MREADEAAAREEYAMTVRMIAPKDEPSLSLDEILADPLICMTDDELLAALEA